MSPAWPAPQVFVLAPTKREAEAYAREVLGVRGAWCFSATGSGVTLEGARVRPGSDRVVLVDATLEDGTRAIRILLGTLVKSSFPVDQIEIVTRAAEPS